MATRLEAKKIKQDEICGKVSMICFLHRSCCRGSRSQLLPSHTRALLSNHQGNYQSVSYILQKRQWKPEESQNVSPRQNYTEQSLGTTHWCRAFLRHSCFPKKHSLPARSLRGSPFRYFVSRDGIHSEMMSRAGKVAVSLPPSCSRCQHWQRAA